MVNRASITIYRGSIRDLRPRMELNLDEAKALLSPHTKAGKAVEARLMEFIAHHDVEKT